ncbi:MAG: ABC transporter permease [Lachnospiraceae bacterium]|nr:ABC transporter permease [Lachnospiraceae bacterium]
MKSNEMTGWKQVYSFTLSQLFKQSSFVVPLVILCLAALLIFPVLSLKNKDGATGVQSSSVHRAYLCNSAYFQELPLEEAGIDALSGVEIIPIEKEQLEATETLLSENISGDQPDASAILIDIQRSLETGYTVHVQYAAGGAVDDGDVAAIADAITAWLVVYKVESVDAPQEVIQDITAPVVTEIHKYEDYVKNSEKPVSEEKFFLVYIILFVFFIIINMSTSMVGPKIAEEKTSKVVEYLLTNVRPMALIIGKVLAALVAVLVEIGMVVVVGFASFTISGMLWGKIELLKNASFVEAFSGLSPVTVAVGLVMLLLGLLFFCLLSGLFGATASKVEEIAQGYQTFTLLIMIAMFASLAALTMMPMHGVNGFVKFTAVFPLTSFFILPGLLISGELSVAFAIPATLLSVLATIFLFWFIARVYESAIVASGKVLKLPDLIKMAKNANGKGGKVNEK